MTAVTATVWAVGTDGTMLTGRHETTVTVELTSPDRGTFDAATVAMPVITAGVADHIVISVDGVTIAVVPVAAGGLRVDPGDTIGLEGTMTARELPDAASTDPSPVRVRVTVELTADDIAALEEQKAAEEKYASNGWLDADLSPVEQKVWDALRRHTESGNR